MQYVLVQELEAAKLRISQNEQDIKQLQMLVVESKLDARINSVIDARIQAATQPQTTVIQPTYRKEPIQAPVEPELDRFYIQPYGSPVQAPMSTQPVKRAVVYQSINSLPPARRVYVQTTHRVQQVRQVR